MFEPAYLATACAKRKLDEITELDNLLDSLKIEIDSL